METNLQRQLYSGQYKLQGIANLQKVQFVRDLKKNKSYKIFSQSEKNIQLGEVQKIIRTIKDPSRTSHQKFSSFDNYDSLPKSRLKLIFNKTAQRFMKRATIDINNKQTEIEKQQRMKYQLLQRNHLRTQVQQRNSSLTRSQMEQKRQIYTSQNRVNKRINSLSNPIRRSNSNDFAFPELKLLNNSNTSYQSTIQYIRIKKASPSINTKSLEQKTSTQQIEKFQDSLKNYKKTRGFSGEDYKLYVSSQFNKRLL